jgi:UPF0755 protein
MKIKDINSRLSGRQKAILLIIFLIPVLLLEVINYFAQPVTRQPDSPKIIIEIPRGATLNQIADTLALYNVIEDKELFVFWVKSLGYETKLKAGHFSVPLDYNEFQIVEYLLNAKEKTIPVTLLEGWQLEQIAKEIEKKLNISAEEILKKCTDSTYINSLGLNVPSLEGYLLPDTYYFSKGESAERVINHLFMQTKSIFNSEKVRDSLKEFNMTQHQILTLASIIEGEAILDNERPLISSLYHNRLKKGMRLQADPTIQYILDGPPRRLLLKHLEIDSPYNSYKYSGLPPGPINNPGKASILAAIFPADTNYLYMVAVGDGSHTFSTNLSDHNKAKMAFDKIRRKVAREKRNKGN